LVKELRLAGISTMEAANAFLPAFVQTYNGRFAKPPARDRDLHRPIAGINDLDDILCWREQRSVSRQLVVNYNRMKFMLRPDKTPAEVAGKLVDIYDFPDGRLEIRWKGLPLSYCVFDHLQRVNRLARQGRRSCDTGVYAAPAPATSEAADDILTLQSKRHLNLVATTPPRHPAGTFPCRKFNRAGS
jgi:hypothetical protein